LFNYDDYDQEFLDNPKFYRSYLMDFCVLGLLIEKLKKETILQGA